jgi:anthranilate synthase component 1
MTTADLSAAVFSDFHDGWSSGRPQVVVRRLVDDLETPVSAFLKVGRGRTHAFLLESVEGGAVNGRYSIITREPDVVWRCRDGQAERRAAPTSRQDRFTPDGGDALASLRALMAASRFDLPDDLPPMAAGLFGVFGYDMVRLLEPLGAPNPDPLDLPDAVLTRPAWSPSSIRCATRSCWSRPPIPTAGQDAAPP